MVKLSHKIERAYEDFIRNKTVRTFGYALYISTLSIGIGMAAGIGAAEVYGAISECDIEQLRKSMTLIGIGVGATSGLVKLIRSS